MLAGEQNGASDVPRRLGEHDRGGPLVDGEVPRPPRFIKVRVRGGDDVPVKRGSRAVGGYESLPGYTDIAEVPSQ